MSIIERGDPAQTSAASADEAGLARNELQVFLFADPSWLRDGQDGFVDAGGLGWLCDRWRATTTLGDGPVGPVACFRRPDISHHSRGRRDVSLGRGDLLSRDLVRGAGSGATAGSAIAPSGATGNPACFAAKASSRARASGAVRMFFVGRIRCAQVARLSGAARVPNSCNSRSL